MASLWDVIVNRGGKNASAEQLKKQDEAERAAAAKAKSAEKERAEREAAQQKVKEITFKKGGSVGRGDGAAQRGKTRGKIY
jgi:hypothetical protein